MISNFKGKFYLQVGKTKNYLDVRVELYCFHMQNFEIIEVNPISFSHNFEVYFFVISQFRP